MILFYDFTCHSSEPVQLNPRCSTEKKKYKRTKGKGTYQKRQTSEQKKGIEWNDELYTKFILHVRELFIEENLPFTMNAKYFQQILFEKTKMTSIIAHVYRDPHHRRTSVVQKLITNWTSTIMKHLEGNYEC